MWGVFFLAVIGARGGGGGGEGEELCSPPIAVYAHDPALIPEQAHGNMAACTTTERGEEERRGAVEGREGGGLGCSTPLGLFRASVGVRNFLRWVSSSAKVQDVVRPKPSAPSHLVRPPVLIKF